MFLLAAKYVKDNHILGRIFCIFLNNALKQSWDSFNTKIQPQQEDRESSYQVKEILGLFMPLNCSNFKLNQCEKP